MGMNVEGTISFGVVFAEDVELPWDAEERNGDIENWWRSIHGYVPRYEPFTPEGNYAEGWQSNDPRFNEYFAHRGTWMEEHPIPIALAYHGSGEYPCYIIAVLNTGISCDLGSHTSFIPTTDLVVTDEQVKALTDFLSKYGIEYDGEPG